MSVLSLSLVIRRDPELLWMRVAKKTLPLLRTYYCVVHSLAFSRSEKGTLFEAKQNTEKQSLHCVKKRFSKLHCYWNSDPQERKKKVSSRMSSTTTEIKRRCVFACVFFPLTLLLCSLDSFSSSISVTAFSPAALSRSSTHMNFVSRQTTAIADSFFVDGTQKQDKITEIEPVLDATGQTVTVGDVVRVAVEGLEAYQISPKAKGSFNEKKELVPDTSDPIGRRCLKLPVGLRGVVTKLYDVDEVSANFPIQVKFQPGINTEEGYDAPAAFLMHFESHEVEICE